MDVIEKDKEHKPRKTDFHRFRNSCCFFWLLLLGMIINNMMGAAVTFTPVVMVLTFFMPVIAPLVIGLIALGLSLISSALIWVANNLV